MSIDEAIEFYEKHYDLIGSWMVRPGDKVVLGNKDHRTCRFCGRGAPAVTFGKTAHAIPEALGNKSISTHYECDECNELFGSGIENHLGNWSKPMRTFARIRGKSGVPTLKKGGNTPGWRIEYEETGFAISSYEDDPVFVLDEAAKTITFKLKRDPYTPIAVVKAFAKIGLSLMPEDEVGNFPELLAWIRDPDHTRVFADQFPVFYTFQPGPMPNDLLVAIILRRKQAVDSVYYAQLVLAYGNEVFQVILPSGKHDLHLNGKPISMPHFPTPGHPDAARYSRPRNGMLNLSGRELVKGDVASLVMGFDEIEQVNHKP